MLNVQPLDDDIPELDEVFDVQLVEALSADGLLGSTNTSGASVDPERWRTTVTIPATDNPHGLLQFDVSGDSTRFRNVTWVEPLTESPEVSDGDEYLAKCDQCGILDVKQWCIAGSRQQQVITFLTK